MQLKPRTLWFASIAALAIAAVRVFDIMLLKRYLDAPLVPALWVGSIFAFVLLARRMARAIEPPNRTRPQWTLIALDRPALTLLAFCLVLLFAQHWGYQRAASDGREYFVQVRSLVMDHDLDFANEESFGVRGTASIYPFGAPLLWVPFFIAADLWLGLLNLLGGEYARNGFFNPYQRAVGIGSWFYGSLGLALLFRLTGAYFSRRLAAGATIAVCAGSFLFWYFVVDASLPHAVSMFAVTLFVFHWHRTRDDRGGADWAKLGLAGGLMTMIRWQNAAFAVLAAADAAGDLWLAARGQGRQSLPEALRKHMLFAGCFLLAFSPQMWFWNSTRGGWLDLPSGAHAVNWAGPLRDVLFTPDHGLFTWSPLIALAMIGFLAFVRRDRWMGSLLLLAFLAQVYVLGTVESPGYGFGTRRMASCAVLFVLGLAAMLHWLRRHPIVAPAGLTALLVTSNVLFMRDVYDGKLPSTGTVRSTEVFAAMVSRVGNPLAAPMNIWFAWRHGTDVAHYERLGTQTFNNLRIDVGGSDDTRFLGAGWAGPERAPDGAFRWNEGNEALVLAPLKEAADYLLVLEVAPFEPPGAPPQELEIELNGTHLDRLPLRSGIHRYELPIEPDRLRPGVNSLRFSYAHSTSPQELGLSDDTRRLAVRFSRIELLRQ